MNSRLCRALGLIGLLGGAAPALAQPTQGVVVGGSVAAATVNGGSGPLVSGAVSYRVNRAFGFGVEFTSVLSLPSTEPIYQPLIASVYDDIDSRLTMFTTNARVEVPTLWPRVIPFMIAGGGVASLKTTYDPGDVRILTGSLGIDAQLNALGIDTRLIAPTIYPSPEFSQSTLYMALTLGGGASLLWTDRISIDIDGRVISLHGANGKAIGRFGAGVSYRF